MMPSKGPPTPKGVGGPTPPLVSKGREEEEGTRMPTGGFPSSDGRGDPTSPPGGGRRRLPQRDEGGSSGIRRLTRSPPLPKEGGKTLSCPKEGYMTPPPPGRAEERTEKRNWKASRTDQKNRHDELTRVGNYAC